MYGGNYQDDSDRDSAYHSEVLIPESNKGQEEEEAKVSLEEIPIVLDDVIVEGERHINITFVIL